MTQRVLIGKFGDGATYGLRVSKPGFDVLTAAGENMIFDMSSEYGRTLYRGTTVIPGGGAGLSSSVPLPSSLSSGAAPLVLFRWVEQSGGAQYAFDMWFNNENGWDCYCTNTTAFITRNFSYPNDTYVSIFVMALRATL